jgi:glycosyltransferase involved in cell wall biosynthesis
VPKSRVPELLDRADVFLNTSTVDNAPVSLLEAMACGLCVVTTDVGGIPWLVERDREAVLVPPRDEVAMAEAARRVMAEPGLAASLSRAGRARAETHDGARIYPRWADLLVGATLAEAPS